MKKYCTATPCFRDEPILDLWHKQYFHKTELFYYQDISDDKGKDLRHLVVIRDAMIADAMTFFKQFCDVIEIRDDTVSSENIGEKQAWDIRTFETGVELGSYGVRTATFRGRTIAWVYGTGCAEPRLSTALDEIQKNT